ncbi:uncharacterized protein MICPUCDRAFT_55274 [Micromonas pusilla CCMP1545]|uniref:Predicted protein n=1 Tax=Micromonas pusilla (strain CCMP1545) TaxID=564608 RepID=C1MKB9_MICPC|nr:uncharacterized protein MICPUCDRAFT_55274 [Micromonas pusilla CCMP1545]EEH59343.1 predicted protein [Micromonas pusilla CCMP1545]|eukprot:XP_003055967.1 predicted protein [Micromonas pusilla CCMP1545]
MEAYESSTVRVWQIQYVYTFIPSYEDKPYCRPYSTVLVRCTAVHVHIQYIFMDGNRIFYHTKLSNLRRYFRTFESTFEGTKVLSKYEGTKVLSYKVLSYFRKYFRTKEKYEGTKVSCYLRTKVSCYEGTKVLYNYV